MRIVRYEPNERVDLGDLTASSFYPLGEFRRLIRELFTGEENQALLVQGFLVEQDGASAVVVKLDIEGDGSILSSAIAPHAHDVATGSSFTEHGQLVGGKDFNDQFEGAASASLNFAGAADGTYVVRMRFMLEASDPDNRAFWNPDDEEEFLQQIQTRFSPVWQIRSDPVAGSPPAPEEQWLDLASVVVLSGEVDSIEDLRFFAVEGKAPFSVDQQDDEGGPGDFDREPDRGQPGIGRNATFLALRALAKQVADLKGQSSDGKWDWFSRVLSLTDGNANLVDESLGITAGSTKSLRSVDHVTFTVGDGTDFGDFSSLEACLRYVAAKGEFLPSNITIYLKSKHVDMAEVGGEHEITGDPIIFNRGQHVTIIGATGGIRGERRHRISMHDGTTPGVGFLQFSIIGGEERVGGFHLENVDVEASQGPCVVMEPSGREDMEEGRFTAKNASLSQDEAGIPIAIVPDKGIRIEDCEFEGMLWIHGDNAQISEQTDARLSFSAKGGVISSCVFRAPVLLRVGVDLSSVSLNNAERLVAKHIAFKSCVFVLEEGERIVPGQGDCFIDLLGARGISFEDCEYIYGGDVDCIRLGSLVTSGSWLPTRDIRFRNCRFLQQNADHSTGSIRGIAIISRNQTSGTTEANEITSGIRIENCSFFSNPESPSPDGFGVLMQDARHVSIDRCHFEYSASEQETNAVGLRLLASSVSTAANGGNQDIHVRGCYFKTSHLTNTVAWKAIDIQRGQRITIQDSTFDGRTVDGVYDSILSKAIDVDIGREISVLHNKFIKFRRDGAATSSVCIRFVELSRSLFQGNIFEDCTGQVIVGQSGTIRFNDFVDNKFVHTNADAFVDPGPTVLIPDGNQTTAAVINVRGATWASPGFITETDPTRSGGNTYRGNVFSRIEILASSMVLNAGKDRYASFIGNNFGPESVVALEDYDPAVLPDTDRSHGWDDDNINTVGSWTLVPA